MPRKAKEKIDKNEIIDEKKDEKKSVVKKSTKKVAETTPKKTTSRKSALAKIIESIGDETEKETKSKSTKEATKKADKKTPKESATKTTKKATAEIISDSTKKSAKKQPSKRTTKKTAKASKPPVQILEYYDLPYKYGNTAVKLLAQTPKTLFVYWEVSDSDIENFKKTYGDDFFNKTKPILIVHNLTLNKTTEIEINDFANCWYLNTDDTDCKYDIELARKFINPGDSNSDAETSDYLYVAQSNDLQSPNNHILFEKIQEFVVFKNVNNDNVIKKNIKSFKFLKDIYKFYKDMYDEEVLNNPSSQFKF